MRIDLDDEQRALRDELRAYFQALVTSELHDEVAVGEFGGGPQSTAALRQLAADGWIGIGWPTEYGGQARSAIEQWIFFDEAMRAGLPIPFLTINSIGPSIQTFGSQEQKDHFLPRILRGECIFAIGYTEPEAGTDLGSLTTRAVVEGDELIINGQKIFTSLTDHADYIWLACRTDPDASKHQGISIVIVPTDADGFSYTPIEVMGDARTFMTYYEDVRVPLSNVVGGLNEGWKCIVHQLNFERVSLATPGMLEKNYVDVREWAKDTKLADGRRVIDQEWVRLLLGKVHAKLDALRLINWKVAWGVTQEVVNVEESSATKVYGTEMYCECYGYLMEVMGSAGSLKRGSPGAVISGRVERAYRGSLILTFGGGTNEIQRDLIAIFGLKMPRSLR
ncbi:MAG: acyl-CoA dehydrogenase family protein [Actinobacteria bacterium]|nr:acyl-CoA dehydrogenase family protein [Actinomycetota bacterium]